jgi:heterotetrameric sarcosine oxidase gamma subunit
MIRRASRLGIEEMRMQFQTELTRQSPLHQKHQLLNAQFAAKGGWLVPEVYDGLEKQPSPQRASVAIADITAMGKLTVRGEGSPNLVASSFGFLPARLGEVNFIQATGVIVAYLYLDEFFILTRPGEEKDTADLLKAGVAGQASLISVVDATSGLVGLSLSGPESRSVMRKLCALSLDEKDFPNLRIAQTSFAKVRTTILRRDMGNVPRYELFADRSYAEYLWDSVMDAGMQFGIQPVGWQAFQGSN